MVDFIMASLLAGLIIGAVPVIYGGMKGKLGLGIIGFVVCIIASLMFGLLLAIPVAGFFVFYIFKKKSYADTI